MGFICSQGLPDKTPSSAKVRTAYMRALLRFPVGPEAAMSRHALNTQASVKEI
jgi:hypothetical protein